MGQVEVLEFLEAHPGHWFSASEIRERVDTKTNPTLKKLRERGEIQFRKTDDVYPKFQYSKEEL